MGNATVPAEGSRGPPSQIKIRTTITQVTESAAVEASLTLFKIYKEHGNKIGPAL